MELKATITKYRVGLNFDGDRVEESQQGVEGTYPETRTINSSDLEVERRRFIDELASKIAGISHHNREEAIRNKSSYYFKLIVSKIT